MTDWQKWVEKDWKNWLEGELEKRKRIFAIDPDELIAGYNRERSHARSYEGRELLELIQNSDDAGADYAKPNRMHIRLTPRALYVANTGVPFSPEGVKSLMVSDKSPKQLQRTRCIGYKGLGFRSVLGWASTIAITSGRLAIGFSQRTAAKWLRTLMASNTDVNKKVQEVEKEGLLDPIATLSIPYLLDSVATNGGIGEDVRQTLYELRTNYDTVICLVFDQPEETFRKVQKQIEGIEPEILLFLQYLERLEIVTPEKVIAWEARRHLNEVTITAEGKEPRSWNLYSDSGEIPKEYRRAEQPLAQRYEIKLAISGNYSDAGRLYSYFPTEVLFPFPIIAHGAFELTENRQHLINCDINRFIVDKLTKSMADSAEKLANATNPWLALSCVAPQGEIDPILTKLGFREKLVEEASSHKIVPVRSQKFERACNAKTIDGDFDNLLVGEEFRDICLHTDTPHVRQFLDSIGVKRIEYNDLKGRLDRISRTSLPIDLRVEILHRLVEKQIVKDKTPPELLVDEKGVPIPADVRALLPPEVKRPSLPAWVPQRIINPEFAMLLKEKFKLTTVRELVSKLNPYKIQEYNMTTLVSSIVAETNRLAIESPDNELNLRIEMLQAIWTLYCAQKSDMPKLPEAINIILPTRKGAFEPATCLYLGKEYLSGELLEYLYGSVEASFVTSSSQLRIEGDPNEVESFLCWLGVNASPRIVRTNIYDQSFLDNVLEEIHYPAQFEDNIVNSKEELRSKNPRIQNVSMIDLIEDVLETADPHAIVGWIIKSHEKLDMFRVSGDVEAELTIISPYQQRRRSLTNQTISSYLLWLLRNKEWIPLSSGQKASPSRCTLARGLSKEVSALVGYPDLSLEHPLLRKMRVDKTALKNALATAGVVTELDELSWDSYYSVLLDLPRKDPEGKIARSVYRALIGRGGDSEAPSGEKYGEFLKEGKMFGQFGGERKYYPIARLYYFENPTLPQSMLGLFPSLDLDRRRGSTKVKRLFGVQPFNMSSAKVAIKNFEEHPCSEDFERDFQRLKPYIYALRVEEDSDHSELKALKELSIRLCKTVKCSILVGEEEREIALQLGESVMVDSIAYLVAEPAEHDRLLIRDELVADALAQVVTNLVRVEEIGADIARIAACVPERRRILLDRISGGSGELRLKKAEELMQLPVLFDEEEKESPQPSPPIASGETPISPPSQPKLDTPTSSTSPTSVGPVIASGGGPVQIVQSYEIRRRVRVSLRSGTETIANKSQVNPDRAENLALEFEKAQNRFPEKVSHVQGHEAYGCDILSFGNEADAQAFKSTGDNRQAERYIEVKGSSSTVGAITLKGNELKCAKNQREKYFVYRIYEGKEPGTFELIETPNPTEIENSAIKIQYEIHPFKTKYSKRWDVVEIPDEGSKGDKHNP